jgi:hypothetical protein
MEKQNNKNETDNSSMSYTMIKNCKNCIAMFGFTGKEYCDFLFSVKAMKEDYTVMLYPNNEIEQYRTEFVKKNEYSIGDTFQLDKFKNINTGYFCPRSFWDSVLSKQV